jgi:hypothetical protein
MITIEQYFGKWIDHPDANETRKGNAKRLLIACELLTAMAAADGIAFPTNPATKSGVSGHRYGGFRPQDCPQGSPNSSHKEGMAVDLFDPLGNIDEWCLDNQDKLELCGIYIEHPDATKGWSHWSIRAPKSGRHIFYP